MKILYSTFGLVLLAIVAVVLLISSDRTVSASSGSVTFSHATHKDQECTTCHAAASSRLASDNLLPAPETCTACHDAKDVRGFFGLAENAALTTAPASHDRKLLFSHQDHAKFKGLDCLGCHAGVTRDAEAIPTMETCYACHNNGAGEPHSNTVAFSTVTATNACEACHTTLAGLTPKNHRIGNFRRVHGQLVSLGGPSSSCGMCHSDNFCQTCHTPTNGITLLEGRSTDARMKNAYVEGWPRNEKIDDAKMLSGHLVHPLTYRYTHGFDARAKSTRCETCHEPATFCTPCHRNGYDIAGIRIVPQSHRLAGFVTVRGPESMNRHGRLAKQDMESCATCHEVDGGDPVCVKCHQGGRSDD